MKPYSHDVDTDELTVLIPFKLIYLDTYYRVPVGWGLQEIHPRAMTGDHPFGLLVGKSNLLRRQMLLKL